MEAFIQFVPLIVIVALIYFFSKSNNKKRWFKVGGYLLLLIVSLRVAGVPEYINDYRAEKALAEQMEQGGFVDQGVYYKAQSLNIPTKALYDKHLKEQAEKRRAEDAEKKRLAAEGAKAAEKARIAALTPQQRCEEDLAGCSDIDLCETATYVAAGFTKRWQKENYTKFIEEAALRNLDCGGPLSAKEFLAEALVEKIAKSNELIKLTEHIRNGGDYGLINILDLDAELLFSGKTCTEALKTRASVAPTNSDPLGFIVRGGSGMIAEISPPNKRNAPIYKVPNGCNLFSSPIVAQRSCNIGEPHFTEEIYKRNRTTNIVTKFDRAKILGPGRPWYVRVSDDGENLTSAVAQLETEATNPYSPKETFTIERRAYICRP